MYTWSHKERDSDLRVGASSGQGHIYRASLGSGSRFRAQRGDVSRPSTLRESAPSLPILYSFD